jgi:hypothetical protein
MTTDNKHLYRTRWRGDRNQSHANLSAITIKERRMLQKFCHHNWDTDPGQMLHATTYRSLFVTC